MQFCGEWRKRVYLLFFLQKRCGDLACRPRRILSKIQMKKGDEGRARLVLFDSIDNFRNSFTMGKHWRTLTKISMHMDYVNHDD